MLVSKRQKSRMGLHSGAQKHVIFCSRFQLISRDIWTDNHLFLPKLKQNLAVGILLVLYINFFTCLDESAIRVMLSFPLTWLC